MKTVIVALNSKYIHASLAPWYLKAYCGENRGEIKVLEYTINDNPDTVLASIYSEKADIAAFSCYIWNISHVLRISETLKKVSADMKIVLGGPEVSFDPVQLMNEHSSVDFIIAGEGEVSFCLLLDYIAGKPGKIGNIGGLFRRTGGMVVSGAPETLIEDLDSLPSPYSDEMLAGPGGRIVYFESSRGCPFYCSYCLSSITDGVRYFSITRVKAELDRFMRAGIKQVKFVDRTFNCNKSRAKEIFRYIIKSSQGTNFHFEAAADLFDEEMLDILAEAPDGLIQLEIGIQTTNDKTLEQIDRKTNLTGVFKNIEAIRKVGNINLHLDLIAGLPEEDYESFKRSFDNVYRLRPHQLQLGFLKLLKGSRIRKEADSYGYKFRDYPPYEVLCSGNLSFDEILSLKGLEEILERYYNSGRFSSTLKLVTERFFKSPFTFFHAVYLFFNEMGYKERSLSSRDLYTVLFEFLKYVSESSEIQYSCLGVRHLKLLNNLMKLDYLSSDNSNNLPIGLERKVGPDFKEYCFDLLKNESNISRYLPEFIGMPAKQIFKQVHFEEFDYDVTQREIAELPCEAKTVILFNYRSRDSVTGLYKYVKVVV